MLNFIRKWFSARDEDDAPPPAARRAAARAPRAAHPTAPDVGRNAPESDELFPDETDDLGPGKNVLSHRPIYQLETGSYETLKIVDGPTVDNDDDAEVDPYNPYNTGGFDRSRNWDKQFRK